MISDDTTDTPDMESLFDQEVNLESAKEVNKRAMDPPGTYITDPDEFPVTVTPRQVEEKDARGTVTGTRLMAAVSARAMKGEHVTFLRFNMSPDLRHKRIYDGREWTGELDESKDDLASRLWANAVSVYESTLGYPPKKNVDVLHFLAQYPVACRTMQGDNGLVVLEIRGRRSR